MYPSFVNRGPFPPFHSFSQMDHRFCGFEDPQLQTMFQPHHSPSFFRGYHNQMMGSPTLFGGGQNYTQGMPSWGSMNQSFPMQVPSMQMPMAYGSSPCGCMKQDVCCCQQKQVCMQPQLYQQPQVHHQPQHYVQPQADYQPQSCSLQAPIASPVAEAPKPQKPIQAAIPPPEPIALSPMQPQVVQPIQQIPVSNGEIMPTEMKVYNIEGTLTETLYKLKEEAPIVEAPIVVQPSCQQQCECVEIVQPYMVPCGSPMRIKRIIPEGKREMALQEVLEDIKSSIKQLTNIQKAFRNEDDRS
jgi:hypothetical protein